MTLEAITTDDAIRFARLEGADVHFVAPFLEAAVGYVRSYTGIPLDEENQYPELAIAALVLFADFYDNRSMTADRAAENRTVQAILDMHRRNLVTGGSL